MECVWNIEYDYGVWNMEYSIYLYGVHEDGPGPGRSERTSTLLLSPHASLKTHCLLSTFLTPGPPTNIIPTNIA